MRSRRSGTKQRSLGGSSRSGMRDSLTACFSIPASSVAHTRPPHTRGVHDDARVLVHYALPTGSRSPDYRDTLPLRGALDTNVGVECADRPREGSPGPAPLQLYSAAMATAYQMETTVADWPRLLVSDAFLEMVHSHAAAAGNDPHARMTREIGKKCREFLFQDTDGLWRSTTSAKGSTGCRPDRTSGLSSRVRTISPVQHGQLTRRKGTPSSSRSTSTWSTTSPAGSHSGSEIFNPDMGHGAW